MASPCRPNLNRCGGGAASTLFSTGGLFVMEVQGKLVVKLSVERAAELREAGLGEAFDPGHGRPMKKWVANDSSSKIDRLKLSREALEKGVIERAPDVA